MNLIKTKIEDVIILEPNIFRDERGSFIESFNKKNLNNLIGNINFVQENESMSHKDVLRGLHFQNPPFAQSKLVRCVRGEILDIALDLRKKSKSYGQHVTSLLSEKNKKAIFIPKGFAHGFLVLSESAVISYKVDNYYKPDYENGVLWNDKDLKIDWKINSEEVILSEKDKNLAKFSKINNPF
tara:strand:- start:5747 stop:6295 length:549 start_codon:yes stop_codon:yes gene_type:complete